MAKLSIKSERITPFGGIYYVRELFSRYIGPVIDEVLGLRCTSYGYQYSEIVGSLSSVYFCGGGKERIFDDLNNGFGWARLPKSFMAENTVFLLLTAIIRNFYKFLMGRLDTKAFGLKKTSRIKAFVFKFISVPAKWIRTARHYQLNIYTDNKSYQNPFAFTDG